MQDKSVRLWSPCSVYWKGQNSNAYYGDTSYEEKNSSSVDISAKITKFGAKGLLPPQATDVWVRVDTWGQEQAICRLQRPMKQPGKKRWAGSSTFLSLWTEIWKHEGEGEREREKELVFSALANNPLYPW